MKFSKFALTSEEAEPYIGLPYDAEPGVIISDEIFDTSRWSTHHEIIFNYEGKVYSASYSVGSTEQQDELPWEYDDYIDCVEVRAVNKVVTVWEPVLSEMGIKP